VVFGEFWRLGVVVEEFAGKWTENLHVTVF
jgi:hypothetical protein